MNQLKQIVLTTILFISSLFVKGQSDSLSLVCPLENGTIKMLRASDKDYQKTSEYGVMLSSKTDSLIQAVHDASVVIVARTEDAKFDVVLQYKTHFFWYAGVVSPRVKIGAKIKAGTTIGAYKAGDLIELLMFTAEEPVNPRKYLKCK